MNTSKRFAVNAINRKMPQIAQMKTAFILYFLFGQVSHRNGPKLKPVFVRVIAYIPKVVYFVILIPSILILAGFHRKNPKTKQFTAISQNLAYTFFVCSNLISLFTDLIRPATSFLLYDQINYVIAYCNCRMQAIKVARLMRDFTRRLALGALLIVGNVIIKLVWPSLITAPVTELFIAAAATYRYVSLLYAVHAIDSMIYVVAALSRCLEGLQANPRSASHVLRTLQYMKWIHFRVFRVSELLNKR